MTTTASETRRGDVTIRDLSKTFHIGTRALNVLKGVNLHIRGGECLAIVGASGSGKTTLLRVLAGLEEADEGRVLIDGEPVHASAPSARSSSRSRACFPGAP